MKNFDARQTARDEVRHGESRHNRFNCRATLLGTNIPPQKGTFESMIFFFFSGWDMCVSSLEAKGPYMLATIPVVLMNFLDVIAFPQFFFFS